MGAPRQSFANMGEDDAILEANAAYYRAFATGNFAAMSRIWADEQVSCVHPAGRCWSGARRCSNPGAASSAIPGRSGSNGTTPARWSPANEGRVLCDEVI